MRETLIAFVRATQAQMTGDQSPQNRSQVKVSVNDSEIWFGYGYYAGENVLLNLAPGWQPEEVSVEEGVGKLLATIGVK